MNAKKYIYLLSAILYLFVGLNVLLWHTVVKEMFTHGEINRMGSIRTTRSLTPQIENSMHHTELNDYIASGSHESFDVLTIGDSYSNGGGYVYYQDYLADQYGLKVINARLKNYDDYMTFLYMLDKTGLLDEISPDVVILESIERHMQERFGRKIMQPVLTKEDDIAGMLMSSESTSKITEGMMPSIMYQANMNYIINKLFYNFVPDRLSSLVYIKELSRPLFTNPGYEYTLLHYAYDMHYLDSPVNVEIVNQNLNNLAHFLSRKGIKLVFFTATDKSDLYYPYIIDKRGRPENTYFQRMREVSGKDYVFIDVMKLLRKALEEGETDIYWLVDTHWSHKGMKIVCDELVKYILP